MDRSFFSRKIIDGALWFNVLALLVGVLSFLQLTISAKILGPKEIGLIAIFLLAQGMLEAVSEIGLRKAAIQKKNIVKEHLDTVFTVSLIKGAALFVLINFFQRDILLFLDSVESDVYFTPLSFVFLLQGLRNPFVIYFQRELDFRRHAVWQSAASVIKFLVVVSLVLIFESTWSIVVGILSYELSLCILSYTLTKDRPGFRFSRKRFSELFSYGRWVFLSTLVMLIDRQGAQFVTTKLLTPEYLALLYVGLQMSKVPQMLVSQIKNTLFPVFSKLNSRQETQEIERYFRISSQGVLLLIVPLLAFVSILEDLVIKVFLGDSWVDLNGLLSLIFLSVSIESFNSISIATFNAIGKPRMVFYINTIRATLLLILSILFIDLYGLIGIGYAFVIKSVSASMVTRYFLASATELRISYISIFQYSFLITMLTALIFMSFYTFAKITYDFSLWSSSFAYFLCFVCSWILVDKVFSLKLANCFTYTDLMGIILRKISEK